MTSAERRTRSLVRTAFGHGSEPFTLLSRLRVITPDLLARYRKHAIMANLVLSAILTPTSDLFNLLLMAGPLIVLYEIGILSARLFGRPPARPPTEDEDEAMDTAPTGTAGRRVV